MLCLLIIAIWNRHLDDHKTSQQRLEAFKKWALRRMLRIGWIRHITNEEVLRLADTKRSLFQTVKQRKLSFFGHIMRHDSLQRNLIEGMVEGKRGRGRLQWSDILQWADLNFEQCKRMAQNRKKWRSVTAHVNRHATR